MRTTSPVPIAKYRRCVLPTEPDALPAEGKDIRITKTTKAKTNDKYIQPKYSRVNLRALLARDMNRSLFTIPTPRSRSNKIAGG